MNKCLATQEAIIKIIRSGEWTANNRIPTEAALCERFGVSRQTIRTVLENLRDMSVLLKVKGGNVVSPYTGKRVFHIISQNQSIAYHSALLHFLHQYMLDNPEWTFQGHDTGMNAEAELMLLRKCLADPLSYILISDMCSDEARKIIADNPHRIITFGPAPELAGKCLQINTDIECGAKMMMDYLHSMGHKKIWYLGIKGERYNVWRDFSIQAGVVPGEDWATTTIIHPEFLKSTEICADFLKRFMSSPDHPTAVFCSSDSWALALARAASIVHLDIPGDFSLAGFDGALLPGQLGEKKELTTVAHQFDQMLGTIIEALGCFKKYYPLMLVAPSLVQGNTVRRMC